MSEEVEEGAVVVTSVLEVIVEAEAVSVVRVELVSELREPDDCAVATATRDRSIKKRFLNSAISGG